MPRGKFGVELKINYFATPLLQHCDVTTSAAVGFDHARIDNVVVCICHATNCGATKIVRFENKVNKKLLIKNLIYIYIILKFPVRSCAFLLDSPV